MGGPKPSIVCVNLNLIHENSRLKIERVPLSVQRVKDKGTSPSTLFSFTLLTLVRLDLFYRNGDWVSVAEEEGTPVATEDSLRI